MTLIVQAFGLWANSALNGWLSSGLQLVAAGLLAARALTTRRDRAAWMVLAAAAFLYSVGMLVWTIRYASLERPPFPSVADGFWLGFYPLALTAFAMLAFGRIRLVRMGSILDGLMGALGVATLSAAVILEAVLNTLGGEPLAVATNLAYPVLDSLLLAFVVGHLSLCEWKLTQRWTVLSIGLAVFVVADNVYSYAVAEGNLTLGPFVNAGYSVGLLLIAFSAWLPEDDELPTVNGRGEQLRVVLPSIGLAGMTVGVFVVDHYSPLNAGAIWLATATLVVALIRTGLAFRENANLIESRRQSLQDELTGLANRRMFLRSLSEAIEEASALDQKVAVLLIDLDRFKDVNDSLGHHVGDDLLRAVAQRLQETLRGDETVARLGGDEFCVVVSDAGSVERAQQVARRVLMVLEEPVMLEGMRIDVGASIGVSLYPDHGTIPTDLLRSADVAMYQAKATGGGEHALYDPDRDDNPADRLALMGDCRGAIARGEIEVFYQPRFDVTQGRLTGLEALVRWRHPTLGLLPPAAFLPGIERSALIFPLTEHVLVTALHQFAGWLRETPDLTIAVNLSARLLHTHGLPEMVARSLADAEIPADRLELEITETMLMANPERATELLNELAALGVRIAVDDFGVGHASLTYLTNLPVSILKIDRSFISRMGMSDRDTAVVAALVDLSGRLGMVSVAEGIEDEGTLSQLTSLGCDEVQGFLLARPVPGHEIDALVACGPWGHRVPVGRSA